MTEVVQVVRCANCGGGLSGEFCSACGQRARDLQRPFRQLVSQLVEDVFSLDSRLARTVGPLLIRPGLVTREYLAGRRMAYVPPVRAYLIAAFVFFGLFTLFPSRTPVYVFYEDTPEALAARGRGGSQVTFSLPRESRIFPEQYREAAERAVANPRQFASAVYAGIPRAFFVLLPVFAVLLELFYRKQGYYIEHLVFTLYYHAFLFTMFSVVFLVSRTAAWVPGWITAPIGFAVLGWSFAYLPIALRRVYGGSRGMTALKVVGLSTLYGPAMIVGFGVLTLIAISRF